ncbi:MAG: hypothetical protein EHM93_05950 [Bacteroidales bacterium]|nr:MAG: hypothetical protein EHM93_05950 [Bacteroidales bacterium]
MRKTIKFWAYPFALMGISIFVISSCSKDDSSDRGVYVGSASRGDLVTFEINKTDKTYSVDNETTGASESGSYTIMDGELDGIYKVSTGGHYFYAVELDNQALAANFPSGHAENKISFGVSSSINNVGKESQIAGNYIYIHFCNSAINGNVRNKEWGIVSVLANGTLYIKPYATGGDPGLSGLTPLAPEEFNTSLPLSSGDLQGSWSVNGDDKAKLNVGIQGTQYTGFSYTSGSSATFLLDMGTGNGYILGLKIPSTTIPIAQLTGTYKFVGVVEDGKKLGGNALIKSDGTGTCALEIDGVLSDNEYFENITQCPHLPNVLYADHFDPDFPTYQGKAYFVLEGDIMMYFIFDNEGLFNAYGAGAKMN